jgi:hypothetical protein
MDRSAIVFAVLLASGLPTVRAQLPTDLVASTILIECRGPTDRYMPPMIVSSSNAGIARGRARIEKGKDLDFIDAHIVDDATVRQLAALILAIRGDGPNQLNSSGAVEFTVMLPNSTRDRDLVQVHAAALLKSLLSSTKDGDLQSALKGFLDYEISFNGQLTRPAD